MTSGKASARQNGLTAPHELRRVAGHSSPKYREDLDAIVAWVAKDKRIAATDLWLLLIDEQVDQRADPNFPHGPSTRVPGAHELVAHENYIVYFDPDESNCSITVRTVVHVA